MFYEIRLSESKQTILYISAESLDELWDSVDVYLDPGACDYRRLPHAIFEVIGKVRRIESEEDYEYSAHVNICEDGEKITSNSKWKKMPYADEPHGLAYRLIENSVQVEQKPERTIEERENQIDL